MTTENVGIDALSKFQYMIRQIRAKRWQKMVKMAGVGTSRTSLLLATSLFYSQ